LLETQQTKLQFSIKEKLLAYQAKVILIPCAIITIAYLRNIIPKLLICGLELVAIFDIDG
jgi:hypothetical protein